MNRRDKTVIWSLSGGALVAFLFIVNADAVKRDIDNATAEPGMTLAPISEREQTAATAAPRHETAAQKRADARAAKLHDWWLKHQNEIKGKALDEAQTADSGHETRVQMYAYWKAASAANSKAVDDMNQAADALGNGNLVDASTDFSNCASDAQDAFGETFRNVPDGWGDVAEKMRAADSMLKSYCETAVSALDNGKPSSAAEAKSELEAFNLDQIDVVLKARELWENAGGDPRAL